MSFSPFMCERIAASAVMRVECESRFETITGEWKLAQETRDSREKSLMLALDEVETEHGKEEDGWPKKACKRITELHVDLRKARDAFDVIDRDKRSTADRVRKLGDAIFTLIGEAIEGGTLFDGETKRDPHAWKKLPIADLMGSPLLVEPLITVDIRTLEELKAAWESGRLSALVRGGEVSPKMARDVCESLTAYMERIGKKIQMPGAKPWAVKPAPKADAGDEDGDEDGEQETDRTVDADAGGLDEAYAPPPTHLNPQTSIHTDIHPLDKDWLVWLDDKKHSLTAPRFGRLGPLVNDVCRNYSPSPAGLLERGAMDVVLATMMSSQDVTTPTQAMCDLFDLIFADFTFKFTNDELNQRSNLLFLSAQRAARLARAKLPADEWAGHPFAVFLTIGEAEPADKPAKKGAKKAAKKASKPAPKKSAKKAGRR